MKLKNKKGFTLIELLAVIVVLAIIALIATPIVMNTIKNAKKGAAERSADNYIKQVETAVAEAKLEKNSVPNGTYTIDNNGNLIGTELPNGKLEIEMSGNKPSDGKVAIKNGGVSQAGTKLVVGDFILQYNQEKKRLEAIEKGNTSVTYTNGEVVYFNVSTGTKCSSLDYTLANSNTGYNGINPSSEQTSCLKFYAFNDDGGDTINLILDHNTTATIAWNSSGSNKSGPSEVLTQLNNDTKSWVGTEIQSNYTMDQSTHSGSKYTIDYSEYKARLITAQEVAQITGNASWDEKTTVNYYYLDSKTSKASDTCTDGNTTGCSYGWLYDRTNTSCIDRGCLNNSDQETYGYWTASSRASGFYFVWRVRYSSHVGGNTAGDANAFGVRPVITVSKSNLS